MAGSARNVNIFSSSGNGSSRPIRRRQYLFAAVDRVQVVLVYADEQHVVALVECCKKGNTHMRTRPEGSGTEEERKNW